MLFFWTIKSKLRHYFHQALDLQLKFLHLNFNPIFTPQKAIFSSNTLSIQYPVRYQRNAQLDNQFSAQILYELSKKQQIPTYI